MILISLKNIKRSYISFFNVDSGSKLHFDLCRKNIHFIDNCSLHGGEKEIFILKSNGCLKTYLSACPLIIDIYMISTSKTYTVSTYNPSKYKVLL